MWYKDTSTDANLVNNVGFKLRKEYIINKPDPKGTFSFKIPLKHIFGFCEDYDKILYGMKQTLILTRNNDNDAIFRVNAAANGKIVFDKISWNMPHVMPADEDNCIKLSRGKKHYRLDNLYQCIIIYLGSSKYPISRSTTFYHSWLSN